MLKVLIVEDDVETAAFIQQGLKEAGHIVDLAKDGLDGVMLAQDNFYDVLIIDRMLPKLDGVHLLQILRQQGVQTPALFLSALGSIDDKLAGFAVGGDDYLVKPFAFAELSARIHSLARRPHSTIEITHLTAGDLHLDITKRQVKRAGQLLELLPTEFRLLEYLLLQKGRLVTKTMILEKIWDFHFDPKTSIVETHMSRLRAKVDKPFSIPLIKTLRGSGYMIDDS